MSRRISVFGVVTVTVALLLTACAGGPQPHVEVNQQTLRNIKRIDVVTHPEIGRYLVRTGLDAAAPLGGYVGASTAGEANDIRSRFLRIVNEKKLQPYARLATQVTTGLSKAGYMANQIPGPWTVKDSTYYITYKDIQSDADAILLLLPKDFGITTDGTFGDLVPYAQIEAVLLKPDRATFLYQQLHVSGLRFSTTNVNYLPARVRWKHSEHAVADPQATFDAMATAIDDIAASIVKDLASRP